MKLINDTNNPDLVAVLDQSDEIDMMERERIVTFICFCVN